jgi:hypothetical protein
MCALLVLEPHDRPPAQIYAFAKLFLCPPAFSAQGLHEFSGRHPLPEVPNSGTARKMFGTAANTKIAATVEEPMAKAREIPGGKKPERSYANAASKESVQAVRERVEALGVDWHDACEQSDVSRNVGYTLLRGEGGIASLRKIEKWLADKEAQVEAQKARDPKERWQRLADELQELGMSELDTTMDGIEEYIRAEKRRRAALQKILRITPPSNR